MKVIGLTGGIGMGKSTAAVLLRQRGLPVVETDVLAHELVEPGQPALAEIAGVFGAQVLGSDGRLLRRELAKKVFSDAKARQMLEGILHPRIRKQWKEQVEAWRSQGKPAAVIDIPLLFETRAESDLDVTVCVACSEETQRRRLRERGWTDAEIIQRLDAQWPVAQKIARADYLVWTDGSLKAHAEQLDRILAAEQLLPPTMHEEALSSG